MSWFSPEQREVFEKHLKRQKLIENGERKLDEEDLKWISKFREEESELLKKYPQPPMELNIEAINAEIEATKAKANELRRKYPKKTTPSWKMETVAFIKLFLLFALNHQIYIYAFSGNDQQKSHFSSDKDLFNV